MTSWILDYSGGASASNIKSDGRDWTKIWNGTMQMEGNSTTVRTWWKISINAIQSNLAIRLRPRRPEKPESDLFDETSTDFLPGTNASATWALPVRGGG